MQRFLGIFHFVYHISGAYGPFIKNVGFGYIFVLINYFQGRKQGIIIILPERHFICPVTEISMRFYKGIIQTV